MFEVGDLIHITMIYDEKGRKSTVLTEVIVIEAKPDRSCYDTVMRIPPADIWSFMYLTEEDLKTSTLLGHLSREEMLVHPHHAVRALGL